LLTDPVARGWGGARAVRRADHADHWWPAGDRPPAGYRPSRRRCRPGPGPANQPQRRPRRRRNTRTPSTKQPASTTVTKATQIGSSGGILRPLAGWPLLGGILPQRPDGLPPAPAQSSLSTARISMDVTRLGRRQEADNEEDQGEDDRSPKPPLHAFGALLHLPGDLIHRVALVGGLPGQ
jgi:hypothetical protein